MDLLNVHVFKTFFLFRIILLVVIEAAFLYSGTTSAFSANSYEDQSDKGDLYGAALGGGYGGSSVSGWGSQSISFPQLPLPPIPPDPPIFSMPVPPSPPVFPVMGMSHPPIPLAPPVPLVPSMQAPPVPSPPMVPVMDFPDYGGYGNDWGN